jgi:hypothetical protein
VCQIPAVAGLLLWLGLLTWQYNRPIYDEGQHLAVIAAFCRGDWSMPADLPMLPAYHVLASVPGRIFGPSLFVLRATSVAVSIASIALFYAAMRHRNAAHLGPRVLHFAWNPLLFPFAAMAYTEAMSMVFLAAAVYTHVRRWFAASALVMLGACLVRQSNVVWVVFMMLWAYTELRSSSLRLVAAKLWAHATVLGLAAVFFVVNGGFTLGSTHQNRAGFNAGQFYVFGLFVLGMWTPIWALRLRGDLRALGRWFVGHPGAGLGVLIAVTAFVALGVMRFHNPHPWNVDIIFLRNWPLRLMGESMLARIAGVFALVAAAGLVVSFTRAQPDRRVLALVWLCSIVFLIPHSLVEPRYYIVPTVLVNFFATYTAGQARWLAGWSLLVSVMICHRILGDGMW